MFKKGDIIRIKESLNWHPNYVGRRYVVLEKDSFIDYKHSLRLAPYEWCEFDVNKIFKHGKPLILVQEEDLKDLIKEEDSLEPIKNLNKLKFCYEY